MRNMRTLALGTIGTIFVGTLPAVAAMNDRSTALAALQTIQRDSTAISAGRYATKAELQAPAREIALAWGQAADILGKDGNVRVEMKVANDSITVLEKTWQESGKARIAAKSVTSSVADLIDATKASSSSS